ncbi:exported hypothetical protein [Cupriavidus necator]|uniref:Uncharacterized protein n=1 Tax=Cupriavidus necator TaxID=106590 RepID=A0A1K0I9I3_CUPNE|nr:exported hypothetical protein [Cupriavidus necator]
MWPAALSIAPWRAALLILGAFLAGAAAGALYVGGRQSGKESAAHTVEKVAGKAIAVADTAQVKQLRQQLAAARSEAAAFQSQLAEAARANPAPTACRLPDGLRDDLNR